MAAKKKEEAPVKVKKKSSVPKADVLKVSKGAKIMASFAELRGVNKRGFILAMGEAEDSYKRHGRLVFGG